MASSSTTDFFLDVPDAVLTASLLCGLHQSEVTSTDLFSMVRTMNLIFSEWTANGITLFTIDQQVQPLAKDQLTFTCPAGTVDIVYAMVRQEGPGKISFPGPPATTPALPNFVGQPGIITIPQTSDLPILDRISRAEWLAKPDKYFPGTPIQYWLDRVVPPVVTLYQVPDNDRYFIYYARVKQIQSVVTTSSAEDPNIPWRWQPALVAALARIVAQKRLRGRQNYSTYQQVFQELAEDQYQYAATEERDRADTSIVIDLSRYRR